MYPNRNHLRPPDVTTSARAKGAIRAIVRGAFLLAWLGILALIVLTVVPAAERPSTELTHGHEHLLAFAIVGLLVGLSFRLPPFVLFVLAVIFTGALELAQIPLPTRHARFEDFVYDTLGSWVGLAIGGVVSALLSRSDRSAAGD